MHHFKENLARYHYACTFFHLYYPLFCRILIKLEFSQQIFEIFSNIKIHKNASSGSRGFHVDRQTDGQTHMTKLIVALRKCIKNERKSKILMD